MDKTLPKVIIRRSKLRNIFLKNRTEENRNNYAKQRNLCVILPRKSKREFYGNLNEKKLRDNKKFWGLVKPVLSNEVVCNEKITLVEQNNIVENDKKTATVFNDFFSNITNLGIPQYIESEPVSQNMDDPLMKALRAQSTDIPTKVIKENSDIFEDFIFKNFNNSAFYSIFPSPMND